MQDEVTHLEGQRSCVLGVRKMWYEMLFPEERGEEEEKKEEDKEKGGGEGNNRRIRGR